MRTSLLAVPAVSTLGGLAVAAALAGTALSAPVRYDPPDATAQLRTPKDPAHQAGFAAAQSNCMSCHSVDYIAMQPPGKGRAFWDAEVAKMVKVYGAPVDEADAKAIAAYLTDTY